MAFRIRWNRRAVRDLDDIAAFIARDSQRRAANAVRKIMQKTDALERFPPMGRIVREFDDDRCRQLVWKQYRIIYWIEEKPAQRLFILAVVHRARLLENVFKIDERK